MHLGGYNSAHHISPNHRASRWSWARVLTACHFLPSTQALSVAPQHPTSTSFWIHGKWPCVITHCTKVREQKPQYGHKGQKGSRNAKSIKSRKTDSWKGRKCSSHPNLIFRGRESPPHPHDASFALTAGNASQTVRKVLGTSACSTRSQLAGHNPGIWFFAKLQNNIQFNFFITFL